jgi:peptide-methionine (R)-S-oxide reductase
MNNQRRQLLRLSGQSLLGIGITHLLGCNNDAQSKQAITTNPSTNLVRIVPFDTQGKPQTAIQVKKIIKTDDAWRAQLSTKAFEVTRQKGTEPPYSGRYWNHHAKGIYACVCCDTALCHSDTKFESGTGWPSFWQPIAKENITNITDNSHGMKRTEVVCTHCDAHLGHVFDDGPKPTGLRYCLNSVSLKFIPLT